jgi:hypothetical protein
MATYVVKYKDMWVDDSLPNMIGALKWWLQTSRTIVVVIWNKWLCTWQASIEFGSLDEKLNYHYSY